MDPGAHPTRSGTTEAQFLKPELQQKSRSPQQQEEQQQDLQDEWWEEELQEMGCQQQSTKKKKNMNCKTYSEAVLVPALVGRALP